ncbi:MAG: purine nucleoside phosphorylase I, inosine and guanosine-specific [Anaerolineae bacterium]|nr:MAG: purine nucleoside phosphorylase I, inosine and guanosine-specific [Anaerolineae bacterium]
MSGADSDFVTLQEIDSIVKIVRAKIDEQPQVGLVLGSGLGGVAEAIESPIEIPAETLSGWPESTVEGHAGKLVFGKFEGQSVCVVQGRVHFYEGHSMSRLAVPVRVLQRLGAGVLIVTNAAGGVNQSFEPGDVMLITDHINFPAMAGHSPLLGPNLDQLGPRFPDMSQAYDRELQEIAREVAVESGIELREGVYFCLAGPAFETPAELRFLQGNGADAVGMSTAPEVTVARHGGMRVLGFSGISNRTSLNGDRAASHEEVLEAGSTIAPKLVRLIKGVIARL